jgi:hypothetical protein
MEPLPIRVLVLGSLASGKSSFLSVACRGEALAAPRRTVGCASAVSLRRGGGVAVEFLEVGGAAEFQGARDVFYDAVDAVILVCDASLEREVGAAEDLRAEFAGHLRRREEEERRRRAAGGGGGGGGGGAGRARGGGDGRDGLTVGGAEGVRRRAGRGEGGGGGGGGVGGGGGEEEEALHAVPLHRAVARRLQQLPLLVVANKADLAAPSLVSAVMHSVAGGSLSSPASARQAAWLPASGSGGSGGGGGGGGGVKAGGGSEALLASPRAAGTVSSTKLAVAVLPGEGSGSGSGGSGGSGGGALFTDYSLCGCRWRRPKVPRVQVDARVMWTVSARRARWRGRAPTSRADADAFAACSPPLPSLSPVACPARPSRATPWTTSWTPWR